MAILRAAILALLLNFAPDVSQAACRVDRSVSFCRDADCSASAEKDFQTYRAQEIGCGVLPETAPNIQRAKGPPKGTVVLIHGLSANPLHMTHVADQLTRDGYNVVLPILHGHGGSDQLLAQADLNVWKADVHFAGSVAEKMQKPLYIMGHSTGGVMAALEASLHPGKYKAIIGMDPALNLQGKDGPAIKQACIAKKLWTFPSEVPAIVGGKKPGTPGAGCHEEVVKERAEYLSKIITRYCERGTQAPPTNMEFTLQSLCALSRATEEMTADRMAKLPPALMFLSKDPDVFGVISREKLISAVRASPANRIEQSAAKVHGLLATNCSRSFNRDMVKVKSWMQTHAN